MGTERLGAITKGYITCRRRQTLSTSVLSYLVTSNRCAWSHSHEWVCIALDSETLHIPSTTNQLALVLPHQPDPCRFVAANLESDQEHRQDPTAADPVPLFR